MEDKYGWPVLHREGWPDLVGGEKDIYDYIQLFNARSKAIKAVFINQFGFDKIRCGKRVPHEAEFDDLRIASDAEFGFSVYEPFGIAQIETIPFGGIAVLSSSCGAAAFLEDRYKDAVIKPFYILDFVAAGKNTSVTDLKNLNISQRTAMENEIIERHADEIFKILPLTQVKREQYLQNAQKYAERISWDASAQSYILQPNRSTL